MADHPSSQSVPISSVWIVSLEWNFPPSEVTGDTGIVKVFAGPDAARLARACQQQEQADLDADGRLVYQFSIKPNRYCIGCGEEAEQHAGGHECANPDAEDFCDQCGAELKESGSCDNDHDEWEIDVHCHEFPVVQIETVREAVTR